MKTKLMFVVKAIGFASTILYSTGCFTERKSTAEDLYDEGVRYFRGEGVEQDLPRAFKCFKESAELGWVPSIRNVGLRLQAGQGVEVNLVESHQWLLKAARLGEPLAQTVLGDQFYHAIDIMGTGFLNVVPATETATVL